MVLAISKLQNKLIHTSILIKVRQSRNIVISGIKRYDMPNFEETMRSLGKAVNSFSKAHRSPRYVILALVALISLVFSILLVDTEKVPGPLESALFELINSLGSWLVVIMLPLGQYGAVIAIPVVALLLALVVRKVQPAIYVLLAGSLAWISARIMKEIINRGRPGEFFDDVLYHGPESFYGLGFPSGHAAVAAAMTTVIWPFVSHTTRKLLVLLTGAVMFSRVYTGAHLPLDVISGAALGVLIGSIVVLIFGVPMKRVNLDRVKRALKERGVAIKTIKPASVDARGSVPYFAKTMDGRDLFVKFYGKEQFSADWLFRMIRYVKYKNLEDEAPYLGLKRSLEHEALMSVVAKNLGVRTPTVAGFFRVDEYFWGLAFERIDGKSLDSMPPEKITDKLLDEIWSQLKILHKNGVAHRDLRAANIFIAKDGNPWIIDFGFAESMANIKRMYMDTSELLASLSTIIGVQRTVASSARNVDEKELIESYPFLAYEAFSGETRTRMKKRKPLLDELREEVAKTVGRAKVEGKKVKLQRISTASLVQIVALGLALFVLVPQFGAFRESANALLDVRLIWVPILFGLTALTFMATSLTLKIFSVYPMKWIDSLIVQLSSSFTNKLLPSGLGGLAINVQFLRTRGHKVSEATSVLTMARIMDFIGFIVPMILILLTFHQDLGDLFDLSISPIAIGAVIAAALLVVAVLTSIRSIRDKVRSFIKQMVDTFVLLATDPIIISKAFLSSVVMNLAFLTAFFVSLQAVGLDISYVEVVVVFAAATLAGSVAPTPGGLGVLEAAMVAALIAIGYDNYLALAGVLLYRLFTYWLPIPFGFVSYRYLINKRLI